MNDNMSKNNPKNAGRKKIFTDEELIRIVDLFLINEYDDEINASKIAEYARENLTKDDKKYEKLKYYHLTDCIEVKNKITEIQKKRKYKNISTDLQYFQNMNIDNFVDKYIHNPRKIKEVFRDAQLGSLEMYMQNVNLQSINKELKKSFKDNKIKYDNFAIQNKELLDNVNKFKKKIKVLQDLINVDNQLMMVEYVKKNTWIDAEEPLEQYMKILTNCNIIKIKDSESSEQSPVSSLSSNIIKLTELTKNKLPKEDNSLIKDGLEDIDISELDNF